jgi:hypothetical protein
MKRKLIIPIVLCLFAGLTLFNIGLANRPASTDTSLDLISVMVKAFDEGEGGGEGWVQTVDLPPGSENRYRTTLTPPYWVVPLRLFDPGTCPWVYFDDEFEKDSWCKVIESPDPS